MPSRLIKPEPFPAVKRFMKKTPLLWIAAAVIGMVACTKEAPVAQFSTEKETYKMGEQVQFDNLSVNAKKYMWYFGDGDSSAEENPAHKYESAGRFGVTLKATGSGGSASVTDSVTIQADLTGIWYLNITGGFQGQTGSMNVVQHEDNTLTGSFVFSETQRKSNFLPTSKINGNKVNIDWDSPAYKFTGTVNEAGTAISGTYTGGGGFGGGNGRWSGTKL